MKRPRIGFRTGLVLTAIVVLGIVGGVLWWKQTEREREIARLRQAIRHLTASYPIARLVVLDRQVDPPAEGVTRVRLSLVDEEGRRRGEPTEATLPGTRIYFEALMVVFEDVLVERGERRAMAFPTRLFSDAVSPRRGVDLDVLDERGVPVAYDRGEATGDGLSPEDYRRVLRRFWELANDPAEAERYGIRVLQGEAVFTEYEVGRYYQIFVEADGGLTIRPELHWLEP